VIEGSGQKNELPGSLWLSCGGEDERTSRDGKPAARELWLEAKAKEAGE